MICGTHLSSEQIVLVVDSCRSLLSLRAHSSHHVGVMAALSFPGNAVVEKLRTSQDPTASKWQIWNSNPSHGFTVVE